jgi:hypothetical protein
MPLPGRSGAALFGTLPHPVDQSPTKQHGSRCLPPDRPPRGSRQRWRPRASGAPPDTVDSSNHPPL